MTETTSKYFAQLQIENPDVAGRYKEKTKTIDGLDPFLLQKQELDYGIEAIPPITSMDIVAYLVLTHSYYTTQQMKAYKSLSSYKYFEAGFVQDVGSKKISNLIVIVGKVKHSQRMNEKSLNVWVIAQTDGSICTAHCTCMAGNSEVCSHVGAILFAAEYASKTKENISCTDVKAQWPVPSISVVPIVPVAEMDWGKSTNTQNNLKVTPINLVDFLTDLEEANCSSGLVRIVDPFASKMEVNQICVASVFDIYNEEIISKSYTELCNLTNAVSLVISNEECDLIAAGTKAQSKCNLWFQQRAGRITASRFKACCRTKISKPSISLIKTVCYPARFIFSTKATKWGINHESVAAKAYIGEQNRGHRGMKLDTVGLIINPTYPQFGASPDGVVSCDCCGNGCLEIKCPYTLHSEKLTLEAFAKKKTTCLILIDGKMVLDRKHSYFFQVQMQLFISKRTYCDFVLWSPRELFVERFLPDNEFWQDNVNAAAKFHSEVIMPELLGKHFTRQEGGNTEQTWCFCEQPDDGFPMLRCDNDNCEIMWFHFSCVGLMEIPDDTWLCTNCSEIELA